MQSVQKVHSFTEQLEFSHQQEEMGFWEKVYRKGIPGFASMVSVRKDGWAQRGGIDRVVMTHHGRQYLIDEKVRRKVYSDIFLERWSDIDRKMPGWIQKDLAIDYLAYAFLPNQTCYLLPFLSLRRAWLTHGRQWIDEYPEKIAYNEQDNRKWRTSNIPVPIPVLLNAIQDTLVINWEDTETEVAKG